MQLISDSEYLDKNKEPGVCGHSKLDNGGEFLEEDGEITVSKWTDHEGELLIVKVT